MTGSKRTMMTTNIHLGEAAEEVTIQAEAITEVMVLEQATITMILGAL
jgi:hypothetical protein